MLSNDDTHRLAAMCSALRPDWPVKSLITFISVNLTARTYRECAVALAWVAADAQTDTPKRVVEAGPWWLATREHAATVSVIPTRCGEHPGEMARNCTSCDAETADVDHGSHAARLRDQIAAAKANTHRLKKGTP